MACLGDASMTVSGDETVGAVISTQGLLQVSGQLTLTDASVASSVGDLIVSGSITPQSGVTLNITDTNPYIQGFGELDGGTIGGPGTVQISPQGMLYVPPGGQGTIVGTVTNNGTIGVDGTLNVNGNLVNNGTFTGSGSVETTSSPSGLLNDGSSGIITINGGDSLQLDLPVNYQGTIVIPTGSTMDLSYPTTVAPGPERGPWRWTPPSPTRPLCLDSVSSWSPAPWPRRHR